jgi:DNA-binding transcriptional regulator YhcF (GntR family)
MAVNLDYLTDLDPDDPRQASQQIANVLRAAILTRKLAPGDRLPSQPELASRYGVARETIKRALETLRSERLIVSRQGSGAFVRAQTQRPVELRPVIQAAFEQPHVAIDFAGFTSETLRDALAETLDMVRAGRLAPETIALRVLLSGTTTPLALPALAATGEDDPAIRKRAERITRRTADGVIDQVHELADLGLVKSATVEVRTFGLGPSFKMYLLNGQEVFFSFYPVTKREVTLNGEPTEIFDIMGRDVTLFHYCVDEDETSHGTQFVESAHLWFDSVWNSIAREYRQ